MKDRLALALAALLTIATLFLVPSWRGFLTDPCLWAVVGAVLTIAVLFITRHAGDHAKLFEVRWLALFLAAMPLIYLARWILDGGQAAGYVWLFIELGGVLIYVTLAIVGLRNHWSLAAGIAAHGIAWDAWHLHRSAYIPSWYAIGCLSVDVGLALYVAARIPAWHRAKERICAGSSALGHSPITTN